ncbi:MAG: 4-hydroxy-tetrahydrodipicolinate reductase [Bacteroidetes bacterium]|nr:4-hydroxy-tetrahydrodipicolinate reductase [Bacteroidota bacterium]
MKIAIIGYGKMGRVIERLAEGKGHSIVLKIGSGNLADLTPANLRRADVAIEFSRPEKAFNNISACLRAGVPVVCGTTAWLNRLEEAKALCLTTGGGLFVASNFSIGVNIFFAVNRFLASLMEGQSQYDVHMEEVHHTQKLDHPSGTAITLAEGILSHISRKNHWETHLQSVENEQFTTVPDAIPIVSKRIVNVPGTHVVTWTSGIDTIEISHTAHSREGFAAGAIAAAEWLAGRQGYFEMKDMLGF